MTESQLRDPEALEAVDVAHDGTDKNIDYAAEPKTADIEDASTGNRLRSLLNKALSVSPVEARGVRPVPLEERTSIKYSGYFWIWFSMNINLLP
jgi:hypothetical protein